MDINEVWKSIMGSKDGNFGQFECNYMLTIRSMKH